MEWARVDRRDCPSQSLTTILVTVHLSQEVCPFARDFADAAAEPAYDGTVPARASASLVLPETAHAGWTYVPGLLSVARHSGLRSFVASARARRTPSASNSVT